MTSQTVFVDMDGVLCDFQTAFNRERLRDPAQPFPQSILGFYRSLMPADANILHFEGFRSISFKRKAQHLSTTKPVSPSCTLLSFQLAINCRRIESV
jgi:FMN phosphatase YigB (HAD superfamily)